MLNVLSCEWSVKQKDVQKTLLNKNCLKSFAHHILALSVLLNNVCSCVITTHLPTRLAWTQGSLTNLSNIIFVLHFKLD